MCIHSELINQDSLHKSICIIVEIFTLELNIRFMILLRTVFFSRNFTCPSRTELSKLIFHSAMLLVNNAQLGGDALIPVFDRVVYACTGFTCLMNVLILFLSKEV